MARPPLPPGEKGTTQLGVRLNADRLAKLDELMREFDVTAAEILRMGIDAMHERLMRKRRGG